jgi:hypothetical protein
MKKLILTAATFVLFATPAVWAQSQVEEGAFYVSEEQYFTPEKAQVDAMDEDFDAQDMATQDFEAQAPWRRVTCFAQNARGQTFRASAMRARQAQDMAMRQCFRVSRFCRALGCR